GQVQRMQALVQRMMSGQDVSAEAAELEKSLPPDFQEMMAGFADQVPDMAGLAEEGEPEGIQPGDETLETSAAESEELTAEKARQVILQAVESGQMDREQAE